MRISEIAGSQVLDIIIFIWTIICPANLIVLVIAYKIYSRQLGVLLIKITNKYWGFTAIVAINPRYLLQVSYMSSTLSTYQSSVSVSAVKAADKPTFHPNDIASVIHEFRRTTYIVRDRQQGHIGLSIDGGMPLSSLQEQYDVLAMLPPMYPEWLGDRSFCETHGVRFPYIGGAMANGITTATMVIALANAGMLGFFGAAGLPVDRVEAAINELKSSLDFKGLPWGSNLIYSPEESGAEARIADLYIRKDIKNVSASAYMNLTASVVRYACSGLYLDEYGEVQRKHFLFAKISRPEVAAQFMSPAPQHLLDELLQKKLLTAIEVELAKHIPLAEDITVEADSGGHTDQQTLGAIFPVVALLRDQLTQKYQYKKPIRVGAAGGLGTPNTVAAAFSLGAAYVLTGTVNQACVESGLDESGRRLLATVQVGDVTMTPSSDMFELGVKLQVLKKGTMYPNRAAKLYELYTRYDSLDTIPKEAVSKLEQDIFKNTLDVIWQQTKVFWMDRDPEQIKKAASNPRHKMALIFRSYLGLSSHWAIEGNKERVMDYQIWCGPAIAAFNEWTQNSFLGDYQNRTVVQVALNLLEGATIAARAFQLRSYGVPVPAAAFLFPPKPLM